MSGIKNIKLDDYEAYLGITDPLPWITGRKTIQASGNVKIAYVLDAAGDVDVVSLDTVLDAAGDVVSLDTVLEYISVLKAEVEWLKDELRTAEVSVMDEKSKLFEIHDKALKTWVSEAAYFPDIADIPVFSDQASEIHHISVPPMPEGYTLGAMNWIIECLVHYKTTDKEEEKG